MVTGSILAITLGMYRRTLVADFGPCGHELIPPSKGRHEHHPATPNPRTLLRAIYEKCSGDWWSSGLAHSSSEHM